MPSTTAATAVLFGLLAVYAAAHTQDEVSKTYVNYRKY